MVETQKRIFKSLRTVYYFVRDLQKSIRFYEDVLGLKLKFVERDWAEFEPLNGCVLALHAGSHGRQPGSQGGTATFEVDDILAAKDFLESKGVALNHPPENLGGLEFAEFNDPDGNVLGLVQYMDEKD
jgi:catechol 2,3-dioxygenase-like lactoylglutathione lyase family enzyme